MQSVNIDYANCKLSSKHSDLYHLIKCIIIAVVVFVMYCLTFHCFETKEQIRARIDLEIFGGYTYAYNDYSLTAEDGSMNVAGRAYPALNAIYVKENLTSNMYVIALTHEINHCYNQCYNERENEFETFKALWNSSFRGSAVVMALNHIVFGFMFGEYYCGDLILGYLF